MNDLELALVREPVGDRTLREAAEIHLQPEAGGHLDDLVRELAVRRDEHVRQQPQPGGGQQVVVDQQRATARKLM